MASNDASATSTIDSNMKENTDNKELIKINNNIEPISSDEEDINNSNNSNKSTFADKVKGKKERDRERPLSWAEQAIIPPLINDNSSSNENSRKIHMEKNLKIKYLIQMIKNLLKLKNKKIINKKIINKEIIIKKIINKR